MTTFACLRIQGAMTPDEQKLFLDRFTKVNRRFKGAAVADILDELNQIDAYCGLIDNMFEDHKSEIHDKELVATAIRACVWLHGEKNVTWSEVTKLVLATWP